MLPADIGWLCLHVAILAGYMFFSVWLRSYFLNKNEFYIRSRGPRLLVVYGSSNIILITLFVIDLQWKCLPCMVTRILGFLFPSLLITPMILRAMKIIIVYEDISRFLPLLRFRVVLPSMLIVDSVFAIVGYFTTRGLNGHDDYDGNCIVFHHWLYFSLMMGMYVMLMIAMVVKLRQVEDRFCVSSEIIGHMIMLVLFYIFYIVVVLLVYFNVVDVETITYVRPQYYIIAIGIIGLYLSFGVPVLKNYYRDDGDWSKHSDLTGGSVGESRDQMERMASSTGSPLREHILPQPSSGASVSADVGAYMGLSVAEMMADSVTREALYTASKKALCTELVHFLTAVQEFIEVCESEKESDGSIEDKFVQAVGSVASEVAGPVDESRSSEGRRSSIFETEKLAVAVGVSSSPSSSEGIARSRSRSIRSNSLFSMFVLPALPTLSSSSFDAGGITKESPTALPESMYAQYAQYMTIVNTYLLEYSTEQINISGATAKLCCVLMSWDAYAAAPCHVRKNIFNGAVTEVHSLIRINLFMDIKKHIRAQLKQNMIAQQSSDI